MYEEIATDGERFYYYLLNEYDRTNNWENFSEIYSWTGRSTQFSEFFKNIVSVNMVGRIVAEGKSIVNKYDYHDPFALREFENFLANNFDIKFSDFDRFCRISFSAVNASKEDINQSLRKKILRWSKERFPYCYMCGVGFDYTGSNNDDSFTLEHLWPQSYGGNSSEENILPACRSCNSKKKKNFATWVMPAIQSLIYSSDVSDKRLNEIDGCFKFALHYRYVQAYARKKRKTLKRSFQEVGPWKDVRRVDTNDVADFFNLINT